MSRVSTRRWSAANVIVLTSATMDAAPATDVLVDGDGRHDRLDAEDTRALRDADVLRRRRRASSGWRSSHREGSSPTDRCRCCSTRTADRISRSCQKVLALQLESQWFADQGFAVLVIDGRGTPGRGPGWEREVYRNLADPVLEDQVDGLHAAAEAYPVPRPRARRDPRLVVRRVPRGDGGAASPRRVPRGGQWRARHGRRALRHALHRALPGDARHGRRGVRAVPPARRRSEPPPSVAADPRPRRRQRLRREHPPPLEGADGGGPVPLGDPALGHHARAEPAGGRREPAPAPGAVPARRARADRTKLADPA